MLRKAKNCNIINKFHSLWLMWGGNSPLNYLSINFIISKLFHYVWNKWTHEGVHQIFQFPLCSFLNWSVQFEKQNYSADFKNCTFFPILDQCEQLGLHSEENTRQAAGLHTLGSFLKKKPSRIGFNQKKKSKIMKNI